MSSKKEIKVFLRVYVFTWVFTFVIFLLNLLNPNASFRGLLESYWNIVSSLQGFLFVHIIILIFYVLFLIIRYFVNIYKKKGKKTFFLQFLFRFIIPLILVYSSLKYIIHTNTNENFDYQWNHNIENTSDTIQRLYSLDQKHRGMTIYAIGRHNRTDLKEVIQNNIEWIAVLPYFYQKNEQTNSIRNPKKIGVWSRRDSAFMKSIYDLRAQNIKIHLKPHLWMSEGWRSNINFDQQEDWETWFESYRKTILHYAVMAEKTNAELFCIGTELRSSVKQQPQKWIDLIAEIKEKYSGKLTYAANWDGEFDDVPFWNELDFIGIQAYFPLTENKNPSLEEIKQGWSQHIPSLEKLSKRYQKKILFTEVGYRPDESATKTPWEWGSVFTPLFKKKSEKTQYLAYEALYQKLWTKDWFAGTYIWQWNNSDFEIKGKPAQNSIAKWYSDVRLKDE